MPPAQGGPFDAQLTRAVVPALRRRPRSTTCTRHRSPRTTIAPRNTSRAPCDRGAARARVHGRRAWTGAAPRGEGPPLDAGGGGDGDGDDGDGGDGCRDPSGLSCSEVQCPQHPNAAAIVRRTVATRPAVFAKQRRFRPRLRIFASGVARLAHVSLVYFITLLWFCTIEGSLLIGGFSYFRFLSVFWINFMLVHGSAQADVSTNKTRGIGRRIGN